MSKGFATAEATSLHLSQHKDNFHAHKIRSFDGLTLSAMAVGTYLGASDDATDRLYEAALVHAAQNGINFFDTAINYRCQRSERNIAYALHKLIGTGVAREKIFISTKGGFLPADGDSATYQEYILKCFLNTGIIKPEDIVEHCHCMTPKYLQSQIDLSLNNLKCGSIDLYYLHNPETQLHAISAAEFYTRLHLAFELLENNVADGKIKRYGVATWMGFRQGFGAADRLDLEKIIAVAREVAGASHNFKAIQLPYNLAMLEAVGVPSQLIEAEKYPIIPTAVHHGITVMVSAPLMQSKVLRIPQSIYGKIAGDESSVQKAINFVLSSPGVTAAMLGMKDPRHVDENRAVLKMADWDVPTLQAITAVLVRG